MDPRSDGHFEIIRQWLNDCDSHHECNAKSSSFLPKRLIEVGPKGSRTTRLVDSSDLTQEDRRYAALSYVWGPKPHFCTVSDDTKGRENRRSLTQHGLRIEDSDLPATLYDAVVTTRALGVPYLWIDAVCIIQEGPDADFVTESMTMMDVYGSAYCVLTASRAKGQKDGFLGPRPAREVVIIHQNGRLPVYVCEMVDDFGEHVLQGHLNTRGWTLQERALARRSIFFTEKQTYFECGHGIRCETMTKMHK